MRKAKNFSNRLIAMLLSTAMMFAPILESMPVYAAESGAETEGIGTLPDEAFHEMASHETVSHELVRQTGTGDADDTKLFSALSGVLFAASASDFLNVGGWNESIYAEIAGVKAADVTEVSWSGAMTGKLDADGLKYLVRDKGSNVRIDIPGLKAGTYTLTVKVGSSTLTKSGIEVYAYDRSGYAHFNYTEGVGAYNDDGTLKKNAIVLYVTDENKNTVSLSGVTGIGNILNNNSIFKNLAKAGTPLAVRFIGCVSETGLYKQGSYDAKDAGKIDGLTDYVAGNDNGHMARICSGKDITLEGIGYDAVIDGWGFHYVAQSSNPSYGKSFEVRNLTFINTPEDAVGMEGAQADSNNVNSKLSSSVERCWIHHNEFYCPEIENPAEDDKAEGDGSVDFKRGQYFTCSYNYFDKCHKTNLVGANKNSLQYNMTYHHNYWYMCKARGPLARNANIHMYNNVVEMQRDYVQNARANSYIFSEYNLFYASANPQNIDGGSDGNGVIKSYCDSIASVIKMDNPGKAVEDKAEYVPNNCQFSGENIKYDKFDTDPSLSYIPGNNYKLDTDFTELRKVVASQTGVQKQSPKRPKEITAGEYSVVPEGTTINKIDALPKNSAPGKVRQYAFTVNEAFDLEVAYKSADAPGVLVNEAGENLLTGDGSLENLPAGTYMIQAKNFQPWVPASEGKAETAFSFKEITINTLNITKTTAHVHKWVLDSSQSVSATCTMAGKNFYTCGADKDGQKCDETKEEPVAVLGHSWSEWTVDKPATETEAGQRSRSCTRGCGARETEAIPGGGGEGTGDIQIHDFTVSETSSTYFTISGNISSNAGTSATYNGQSYTGKGLKMESSTKITFSTTGNAKVVLVMASGSTAGTKIDGTKTAAKNGVIEVDVAAGEHTIAKGDTDVLYAIIVIPEGGGDDAKEYTITIDKADGSATTTLTVTKGSSITAAQLPTPTREGYTFAGWVDGSNKSVTLPYTPTADMTIKATWEKIIEIDPDVLYNKKLISLDIPTGTYTSDFQKNGFTITAGEGADQSVSVDVGSKKTIGGTDYTGRLKTGGIGTKDYRSIKVTTEDAATLTMACVVATTNDICELGVATLDESGKFVEITKDITVDGTAANKITLSGSNGNLVTVKLPTADTYYIYSKGSTLGGDYSGGVNFYAINVIYANGVDPVFYTVTFDSKGGLSEESQKVQAGDACVEPAEILKSGYTFDGWYADSECTQKYDFSTPVKSNIILYAKWLPGEPEGEYLVLDMKDLPARDYSENFTRNGFTFKATSGNNLSVDVSAVTVDGVDYTRRLKLNGTGDKDNRNISFTIEADATLTLVAASGKSGTGRALTVTNGTTTYDISDIDAAAKYTQELTAGTWQIYAAGDGVNIYYISVKGESVKAQYVIAIDKQDGTEAVVKTVVEGTELTEADLPATLTREGYTFVGWEDENGEAITVPYTPTKSMTIKAKWQQDVVENQYVITIDKQDGTEAIVKTIVEGTELTEADLPATLTREGYTFLGWVDEEGNVITVPYTPTRSMTIKAKWQEDVVKDQYVITIDKQDGTEAIVKTVVEGTELTETDLPATLTREGYTFVGWEDENGEAITVPYTPTKSMTIKAKWQSSTTEPKIGLHVELAVPDKTYVYTGSAIKPAIIVTNNGELLTEGVDYTVKYSNNIKACEWGEDGDALKDAPKNAPKITITGKGNFTSSTFTNFRIARKDIGDTDTSGDTDSVKAGAVTVAKNSKATPVLVYNGVKLGTKDYTYKDPTQKNQKFGDASKEEAETFEIELEGTGNYTGSRKVIVKAVKKDDLKTFTVTVGKVDLTYNGQSQLLPADAITVQDKKTKETLKNDEDHTYYEIVYGSDTTSAGTVRFSVVGVGEYTGTVSKTYTIKPLKDNSKFYVDKASIKASYDYNSAGVTLGEDLKVYYGSDANGKKLQEGADYKVTYSSNKKVGTGKYTITFLGNFKGSKCTGTFEIGAASLKASGAKVEVADKVFKKAGIYKSVPYVTINGVALKASDYKVEYYIVNGDNTETLMGGKNKVTAAGTTIKVKVSGKGSYKPGDADCVTETYTVCDKGSKIDLSGAKVAFYEKNADGTKGKKVTKLDYTGREVEPAIVEVTIKGKTVPLVQDVDYTVRYVNNKNKGKATVIITAAENSTEYVGSKTATFNIVAKNLKQTGLLSNLFKMLGK